jgi:AcrR family transcriptional regulator
MGEEKRTRSAGRRQRRIARRRDEILTAAARVFAAKGYANATIKEVAHEADVADGTIYNYFEGKRDLLLEIADRLIGEAMDQTISELSSRDPEAYVDAVLRNTVRFTRENRAFLQALATEVWTDDELQQRFFAQILTPIFTAGVQQLQAQITEGEARPCQVEIVVPTIAGSLVAISLLRAVAPDHFLADFSDDEIVEELTRLYSYGLKLGSGESVDS